ncbi:guanosine monophosphate reductase [Rickettsiales bacterium LUAb2]
MQKLITFDDVLIKPKFSKIKSRKDVNIDTTIGSLKLGLPIFSANMDTVTSLSLAKVLYKKGGIGVLHRFCDIEANVEMASTLLSDNTNVVASIGLGEYELQRAEAVIAAGVNYLCIDVAHGAQLAVVEQYNALAKKYKSNVEIMVGNFATGNTIKEFRELCVAEPWAFKVGIGGGSACLTRVQTGCGIPQFSAVIDCVQHNLGSNIISDGGKKQPSDITKAIAAGAKAVMLGFMLAGTDEAPGELINHKFKKYRGSASQESYEIQGKVANWRTFEGESFLVPYKGPVTNVLQNIEGGLRSALTYVGASNLLDFQEKAEFIEVSSRTIAENTSHGKY